MNNNLSSWHNYPKVHNLGHPAIENLFDGEVHVEEKFDGSQFSWGIFNGKLRVRSRTREINIDAPEKMFQPAINTVKEIAPKLKNGWTYRGEFLAKPKHNVLKYERCPNKYIILFDINDGYERYITYCNKVIVAKSLGLEVAPRLGIFVKKPTIEEFNVFLEYDSILGGTKIEGIIIKNYARFGRDSKVLMGKYVSEQFKEKHKHKWKINNPTKKDIVVQLIETFKTEARWNKSVQHMREEEKITDSLKDIGPLIKMVQQDILEETKDEILEALWKYAWPHIRRGVTTGLPEWYKKELLKKQLGDKNES